MAIRLVRQSSETPNITNKDDARMIRYAYGGYNGIIKGYGNELNSETPINGLFKIGSGRVVLQGWEVDIEGDGYELPNDNLSGDIYYSIYLEVSVELETATIKSTYLTGSYPEIDKGDDLTEVPNGTARLVLWHIHAVNGTVTEKIKKVKVLEYAKDNVRERLVWERYPGLKVGETVQMGLKENTRYKLVFVEQSMSVDAQSPYIIGEIRSKEYVTYTMPPVIDIVGGTVLKTTLHSVKCEYVNNSITIISSARVTFDETGITYGTKKVFLEKIYEIRN